MITLENNPAQMGFARFFPEQVYSVSQGEKVTMDLFVPLHPIDEPDKRFPAVVFVQGSAWTTPDTGMQIPQLGMFAQQGYVIAAIRHRSRKDGYPMPAQLVDAKTAVRFLRANAKKLHVDPNRIGAWGTSSGGNTVLLMALTGDDPKYQTEEYSEFSDQVSCVVDFFGPTDLTSYTAKTLESYDPGMSMDLLGGNVDEKTDQLRELSPLYRLDPEKNYPAFLVAHGDADPVVPFEDSVRFVDAVRKMNGTIKSIRVHNAEHEGTFWSQELLAHTIAFLDENLLKGMEEE